jgi:hypothetical protein
MMMSNVSNTAVTIAIDRRTLADDTCWLEDRLFKKKMGFGSILDIYRTLFSRCRYQLKDESCSLQYVTKLSLQP